MLYEVITDEVEHHVKGLHFANHGAAELAESARKRFAAAVRSQVALVVRQYHGSHVRGIQSYNFV